MARKEIRLISTLSPVHIMNRIYSTCLALQRTTALTPVAEFLIHATRSRKISARVAALIGKSIARDRYTRAETASKERFDDQYDIAHVKAKFQQGKAPEWLLVRLGQAITKRRQYIKYVREHRSRIDHYPLQPREPNSIPSSSILDPLKVKAPPKAVTLASRPSQMPTEATTFVSNIPLTVEQTLEDDQSVTTANTNWFEEDADQKLCVPPLADYTTLGQEFPCPFCPTTTKFNSQSSWK
jgi:hypothetical protein